MKQGRLQGLQERFSFETFVSGPANEFAFAVARRVATWADGHFNPVRLPWPLRLREDPPAERPGLGGHPQRADEAGRLPYSAERFTSTFVKALQDRQTAAFKEELRNADLLLIDDVHFVAGKP